MKKITLAVLMAAAGIGAAQAQEVELAKGRLLFSGALVQSGCTITGASGASGDINIAMPGALGVGKVAALAAATTVAFDNLDDDVKYNNGGIPFSMNIECPTPDIYASIATAMGGGAITATTVKADFLTGTNTNTASLYFYGRNNGASGFIPTGTSGSAVGVLAPNISSPNQTVGIAVRYANKPGGAALVDLNNDAGVSVPLRWVERGATVTATPNFDFAYVKAGSAVAVQGGIATATLPFRFVYK